jgi:hypothetical protein
MPTNFNLFSQFLDLTPHDPLLVGVVTAFLQDGSNRSLITLPGGGTLLADGQSVPVDSSAFVQAGKVIGPAPALSALEIFI